MKSGRVGSLHRLGDCATRVGHARRSDCTTQAMLQLCSNKDTTIEPAWSARLHVRLSCGRACLRSSKAVMLQTGAEAGTTDAKQGALQLWLVEEQGRTHACHGCAAVPVAHGRYNCKHRAADTYGAAPPLYPLRTARLQLTIYFLQATSTCE